jgi:RNA-directed DNA polymerase
MIKTLNPMISGWAYYHKYLPTSALDVRMNSAVQLMLRKWAEKRHPNQSAEWIAAEYWHPDGHVGKVFSSETTRLRSFSVKSLKRRDNYKETNPFLTNNEFFTLKTYKSDVSEKGQVNRFLYSSPILLLHGLKKSNFFF